MNLRRKGHFHWPSKPYCGPLSPSVQGPDSNDLTPLNCHRRFQRIQRYGKYGKDLITRKYCILLTAYVISAYISFLLINDLKKS